MRSRSGFVELPQTSRMFDGGLTQTPRGGNKRPEADASSWILLDKKSKRSVKYSQVRLFARVQLLDEVTTSLSVGVCWWENMSMKGGHSGGVFGFLMMSSLSL